MQDITTWLYNNFDVHTEKNGQELLVCCPFCQDGSHHLSVNTTKPVWRCFKCGQKGKYERLVAKVERVSYINARKIINKPKCRNVKMYETLFKQRFDIINQTQDVPDWYSPLSDIFSLSDLMVLHYARKRLSEEKIYHYGMGYCTNSESEFCNRLIIPVEWPYFQARDIFDNSKEKYLNPSIPIGNRMFNYQALGMYDRIIICEGIFSAIATGLNAIAILGKEMSIAQMQRIIQSRPRFVVFAFDAGTMYDQMTLDAANYFYQHGIPVDIRDYDYGDPDECNTFTTHTFDENFIVRGALA